MSIVALEDAADAQRFGGKASQLAACLRAGLPVPGGFALSVDALAAIKRGETEACTHVREWFGRIGAAVAARSSAVGEDSVAASFAGQHLTCLNLLDAEAVLAGLARVFDSAHSEAALAYRERKAVAGPVQIAALVQQLVDPICAGVLFTRNPVTGADESVIEAAWGLGESVVQGLVTPDQYRLTRDGRVIETRIGDKDLAIERDPAGDTREVAIAPARARARCLDSAALAALHQLAQRCQAHFGAAIDLEWALARDALYLLQARPISTGHV